MKTLQQIQQEIGEWARQQFGANYSRAHGHAHQGVSLGEICSFYGVVSELGELAALDVREMQGRDKIKDGAERQEAREDAVADLLVFLCDYCYRTRIDVNEVLDRTWEKVQKRRQATWEADKAKEQAERTVGGVEHEERVANKKLPENARYTRPNHGEDATGNFRAGCEEGHHEWYSADSEDSTFVRCKNCGEIR